MAKKTAKRKARVYTRPKAPKMPEGKLKAAGEYPPKYKVYRRPLKPRKR